MCGICETELANRLADYNELRELRDTNLTLEAKLELYKEVVNTVKLFLNNAGINLLAHQHASGRLQDLRQALKALERE